MLFRSLSIVRLRSSEVTHTEIAYYFVSLALGLLCGIHPDPLWSTPVLSAALVVMMFAVDHPGLHRNGRHQIITLDTAFTNEAALRSRLESLLDADIQQVTITGLDLVRDTTTVDVRFRLRPTTSHDSVVQAPDRASR